MPDASPADLFTAYVLDVRVQVEAQLRQLTEIQQHMETWRAADDDDGGGGTRLGGPN